MDVSTGSGIEEPLEDAVRVRCVAFIHYNNTLATPEIFIGKVAGQDNKVFEHAANDVFDPIDVEYEITGTNDAVWSITTADFDNGFLDMGNDLYIPVKENTDLPSASYNHLMKRTGSVYNDVAQGLGVHSDATDEDCDSYFTDFDNDGDWDLHISGLGNADRTDRLFRKDGNIYAPATNQAGFGLNNQNGTSTAWADFNRDGKEDLYVGNIQLDVGDNAANNLYQNQTSSSNNYLHIKLIGCATNRDGMGARVRVFVSDSHIITKDYGLSSGRSQSSLPLEFGVGTVTSVDSIYVYWPVQGYMGDISRFEQVATNQKRITIVQHGIYSGSDRSMTWDYRIHGHYYIAGQTEFTDGANLTIVPGTHVYINKNIWKLGEDGPPIIIGENTIIDANGTSGEDEDVLFTSQRPNPENTDWGGIKLLDNSYAYLDYTNIEYALFGLWSFYDEQGGRPADIKVNSCRFRQIYNAGIYLARPSSTQMQINGSHFLNCKLYGIYIRDDNYVQDPACIIDADTVIGSYSGIVYYGNSNEGYTKRPTVSYCVLTGTNPLFGTGISIGTEEPTLPLFSPTIIRDSIANYYAGISVDLVNSSCELLGNKVKSNSNYGLYLSHASPKILSTTLGIPNVFNSSKVGMYCDGTSAPYVRNAKFKENENHGVLLGAGMSGTSASDFGTSQNYGYNSFFHSAPSANYKDMHSFRLSPTPAIGNWWGESPPNPFQIIGYIDYSWPLRKDPLPGYEKRTTNITYLPTELTLGKNYPNPFNPTTELWFYLPQSSHADLKVYNLNGQLVRVLADDIFQSGEHSVIWDGRNHEGKEVATGIYFCVLNALDKRLARTMTLIR